MVGIDYLYFFSPCLCSTSFKGIMKAREKEKGLVAMYLWVYMFIDLIVIDLRRYSIGIVC